MLTTAPYLRTRRPSPTTAEFIVSTQPPLTLPLRLALFSFHLARLVLGLAVALVLYSTWMTTETTTATTAVNTISASSSSPYYHYHYYSSGPPTASTTTTTTTTTTTNNPTSPPFELELAGPGGSIPSSSLDETTTQYQHQNHHQDQHHHLYSNPSSSSLSLTLYLLLLRLADPSLWHQALHRIQHTTAAGRLALRLGAAFPFYVTVPACLSALWFLLVLARRAPHAEEERLLVLRGLGIQTSSGGFSSSSSSSSSSPSRYGGGGGGGSFARLFLSLFSFGGGGSGSGTMTRTGGGRGGGGGGGRGGHTRFIPTEKIRDLLINEAFRGFEVRSYLVVVVEGEEDVVVVFPKLLPRPAIVEAVWRGARECLFEEKGKGKKVKGVVAAGGGGGRPRSRSRSRNRSRRWREGEVVVGRELGGEEGLLME
ncbi:GPI-GlcNAc transferase complex, PIG-H component-domain-containing protein [Xylariomycetidae sp. FL2044]|nr:GPI-GlcNAc transferase complex, PIG-H component-domain-containing protein [Xylariomycetidae sp. FL2044]